MSGVPVRVAPIVSGAFSQWAETIRTAVGRGKAFAQAASWVTHSRSSTSGGAPWPMYRVGIRPEACDRRARSATTVAAPSGATLGFDGCGFSSSFIWGHLPIIAQLLTTQTQRG